MKHPQIENNKRTPVEDIGRINLIDRLLSFSGGLFTESVELTESDNFHIVSSHKLLLEGIDFNLIYNPLKHLGYKSVLSVLGPLYAADCIPVAISVKLGLSGRFCVEDIEELWAGAAAAISEHKIGSVSLDIHSSVTGMAISLSSQGKQPKESFVQTPKAVSTDLICVTGNLGAAYMGLQLLEREKLLFEKNSTQQPQLKGYEYILKSYLSPELNNSVLSLFRENSVFPSSGIFITDGLAGAVRRLCRNTSLGARLYLEKIPVASQTFKMAEELNIEATTAVLNGGDDFRLLYTIPLSKHEVLAKEIPSVDIIGHLTPEGTGCWLITPDGSQIGLKAQGWSE